MAESLNPSTLYHEVGRSFANWANVEDSLLNLVARIFPRSFGASMLDIPHLAFLLGELFYQPAGTRDRVAMTDRMIKRHVSDQSFLDDWRVLKRRVREQGETRNHLAHSPAFGKMGGSAEAISQSIFNNKTKRKALDYDDVRKAADDFAVLSADIDAFAVAIDQHLASKPSAEIFRKVMRTS